MVDDARMSGPNGTKVETRFVVIYNVGKLFSHHQKLHSSGKNYLFADS